MLRAAERTGHGMAIPRHSSRCQLMYSDFWSTAKLLGGVETGRADNGGFNIAGSGGGFLNEGKVLHFAPIFHVSNGLC